MLDFSCFDENTVNELTDVVKAFFPQGLSAIESIKMTAQNHAVNIQIDKTLYSYNLPKTSGLMAIEIKRVMLRGLKNALYNALKAHLNRNLPWGSLTGIRPTKLFYELLYQGIDAQKAAQILVRDYDISHGKINLLSRVIAAQRDSYFFDNGYVNFYVHIPFCRTVCDYCSFITAPVNKCKDLVSPYIDALIEEIKFTKDLLSSLNKKVYSVYIGGGTPTAVEAEHLKRVLDEFKGISVEFTCEAGRPDTIDAYKLDLMRAAGVSRICINPQTLNDATIQKMGRAHSVEDFYACYKMAKEYGFIINTDIIAGLSNETTDDFKYTIEGIIELKPHNVTVHTLANKRGSKMEQTFNPYAPQMVDYSYNALTGAGYEPYYLYRQKLMAGGLENVGYMRDGHICKNNVTVMEECLSVAACGAGAISKTVSGGAQTNRRIERLANARDIRLYIERASGANKLKEDFFKKNRGFF